MNAQELPAALKGAFHEDEEILIEAALEGREITVGVLNWKGKVQVLPITEIISENDSVGPAELAQVIMNGEQAVIPNLDFIQQQVIALLDA